MLLFVNWLQQVFYSFSFYDLTLQWIKKQHENRSAKMQRPCTFYGRKNISLCIKEIYVFAFLLYLSKNNVITSSFFYFQPKCGHQ
mmetsp:Transcript_8105/g.11583  ORF Transcript_8105/g.11583 Transcript_8105/m.11583 type:complete len:85 (-) Transcript_8105:1948-2202(-)